MPRVDDRRVLNGIFRAPISGAPFQYSTMNEAQHMLRPVMAQIVLAVAAKHDAIGQAGGSDFAPIAPSRRWRHCWPFAPE
ncbi:hypothetical protein ASD00_35010 [Ensifer sp. Root31]|nr:hypothetical protein ASD00_35010 [Ensifer sp. Root31]